MSTRTAVREQLTNVLSRAIGLVDEETRSLRENSGLDHGAIVARKNMIAFELETIARMAERAAPDNELRESFAQLRGKLEENRKLLEVHIGASRQIARILAEVVRASETDGTYMVAQSTRWRVT